MTIIEKTGKVIYDNRVNPQNMDTHLYREEIKEALEGIESINIRDSRSTGKKLIYLAIPAEDGIVVRLSDDFKNLEAIHNKLKLIIFLVIVAINFIAYFMFKIFNNYISKKIFQIKKSIESEELSDMFFYDDEELKDLWISLKKLYNKNMLNISTIEKERHKLYEIISSVDMGILVIKIDGQIMMYNKTVEKDFIEEADSDDYHMKIKNMQLIKFINKLQLDKEMLKEELYISSLKKYYIVEGKYIPEKDYIIITLKDITKDKEINEIQKRFITNVSHELKTPLTNIKGYLIALEDAIEEKNQNVIKDFINTINKNVLKMEKMIVDFLDTSKIEHSKVINSFQVKAEKLEEDIREDLKQLIENRNAQLIFSYDILDTYGYIKIDYEKILVMLKNLIENGIIYNKSEIPMVKIDIKENEKEYTFIIEDNGIGIPKSDITKVFERFYRVNKARNGDYMGTGLGLSIVKEIVNLHNGYINVDSKEGEGTKITCVLRKK